MEAEVELTKENFAVFEGKDTIPMSILGLIKQHPVLTYFILTFAISWGGILSIVGPDGFPGTTEQFETLLPIVVLAMLAGPSITGVMLTGLVDGKKGFSELLSRLFRWRVSARWYAVALLAAPLLAAMVLLVLSLFSPVFLPGILTTDDKISHLLFGITVGLCAGIFEELGWTGFAIPRSRQHCSILTTGLIVGVLWGLWHLLTTLWGSGISSGGASLALYLPVMLFSFLPPYRVLMVWVYDRTESLFLAMLMHASLTTSVRILDPLGISGAPILIYNLMLAAVLWVVVVAVAVVNRDSVLGNH